MEVKKSLSDKNSQIDFMELFQELGFYWNVIFVNCNIVNQN